MFIFRSQPVLGAAGALMALCTSTAQAHDITNALLSSRAANCAEHVAHHSSKVMDVQNRTPFEGAVQIKAVGDQCTIRSNAVPNHDFNATGRFRDRVRTQDQVYTITAQPREASQPTPLSLRYDNGVFLNGVKLDLLAAGCHGVGNGRIGCNDMRTPYRYDPMAPSARFGTDEHNAHTQPDGTYHYHAPPGAVRSEAAHAAVARDRLCRRWLPDLRQHHPGRRSTAQGPIQLPAETRSAHGRARGQTRRHLHRRLGLRGGIGRPGRVQWHAAGRCLRLLRHRDLPARDGLLQGCARRKFPQPPAVIRTPMPTCSERR